MNMLIDNYEKNRVYFIVTYTMCDWREYNPSSYVWKAVFSVIIIDKHKMYASLFCIYH